MAAIPFSDFSQRFGVEPKRDPLTGRSFFLWDDMFPLSPDNLPYPNFAVQEAAKAFFARGADWLRWRYRSATGYPNGFFVLDGVQLEPKRNKNGIRYYTLADIERMAYALAQNKAIDGRTLATVLEIVLHVARNYGVFDADKEAPTDE